MKKILLLALTWTLLTMPIAFAELTVKPLTPGTTIHRLKMGIQLFAGYNEGKTILQKFPAELEGLPALNPKEPYEPQDFELSEPARGYWVFYPRVYTPIPRDWKVFRQRAFLTPFDYRDTQSDVYYKDFPAGRHQVKNPPNRLVNAGFKALAQMTVKDCALSIHAPTEEGVFRPGARLYVNAVIDNPTSNTVTALLKWRIAGQPREGELHLSLPPRQEVTKEIPLPDLPIGFYLMDAELWVGTEMIATYRFPIGVFDVPDADASTCEPFYPVGAYNKFFLTHHPEIARIYLHAICHSLRKHNLNTLVGPALDDPKEELDIAAKYVVRILVRVDQSTPAVVFGHPSVLAYMFGDEPKGKDLARYKEKYDAFTREHPERPLVSAMVGESVGSLTEDDPVMLWKALSPQVRLARFYPIRKAGYDLLRPPIYKNIIAPAVAFDLIERCSTTPWWYVIQGFGGRPTPDKPDPYWRNPTPEEFTALAHLALAFGARAILSWPLQTHGPEPGAGIGLIAQETLLPEDGKYDAFARIAGLIARAKQVLLRHQKAAFDVRTDKIEVLAVPRTVPETKKNYVYLVNMDAKQPHETKVIFTIPPAQNPATPAPIPKAATDIYTGQQFTLSAPTPSTRTATVNLSPGEGQLWELAE